MTQNNDERENSNQRSAESERPKSSNQRESDSRARSHTITISLDEIDGAVRDTIGKGRDAAVNLGGSVRDSIKSVRATRDSVVMVRLSKDSLASLDELVDAGVTASRSEAAAFLIGEGIVARSDLFDKISEQTRIIREAREKLRQLLDEDEEEDSVSR